MTRSPAGVTRGSAHPSSAANESPGWSGRAAGSRWTVGLECVASCNPDRLMADKRDKIRFSLYLIDGVRCLYGLGVILTLGDPIVHKQVC